MEIRGLIKLYKDLYDKGKITGSGIIRHNELVSKYRDRLMQSSDSKSYKRLRKLSYIEVKKWI